MSVLRLCSLFCFFLLGVFFFFSFLVGHWHVASFLLRLANTLDCLIGALNALLFQTPVPLACTSSASFSSAAECWLSASPANVPHSRSLFDSFGDDVRQLAPSSARFLLRWLESTLSSYLFYQLAPAYFGYFEQLDEHCWLPTRAVDAPADEQASRSLAAERAHQARSRALMLSSRLLACFADAFHLTTAPLFAALRSHHHLCWRSSLDAELSLLIFCAPERHSLETLLFHTPANNSPSSNDAAPACAPFQLRRRLALALHAQRLWFQADFEAYAAHTEQIRALERKLGLALGLALTTRRAAHDASMGDNGDGGGDWMRALPAALVERSLRSALAATLTSLATELLSRQHFPLLPPLQSFLAAHLAPYLLTLRSLPRSLSPNNSPALAVRALSDSLLTSLRTHLFRAFSRSLFERVREWPDSERAMTELGAWMVSEQKRRIEERKKGGKQARKSRRREKGAKKRGKK